jgi:ABC-type taurine transport system substrate-binding protein
MDSLASLFSLSTLSVRAAEAQLLSLNEKSQEYGLTLTPEDAAALMQTRVQALNASGRVEIGSATVGRLAEAFCDSCWINQTHYAETLHELVELFYEMKNETEDRVSDAELIAFMKECFEDRCGGSLELLSGRELEKLAENVRFGAADYFDLSRETRFEEDRFAEEEEAGERDSGLTEEGGYE